MHHINTVIIFYKPFKQLDQQNNTTFFLSLKFDQYSNNSENESSTVIKII